MNEEEINKVFNSPTAKRFKEGLTKHLNKSFKEKREKPQWVKDWINNGEVKFK